MQYYKYCTPLDPDNNDYTPVYTVLSDAEILDNYYVYWSTRMLNVNKAPQITEANCLEDWAVIHWAWPTDSLELITAETMLQ